MSLKNWTIFNINKQFLAKSLNFLLILVLVWQFCFPRITSLAQTADLTNFSEKQPEEEVKISISEKLGEPSRVVTIPVTAYSSTVDQCDSTPCITANGFNLCENNTQNVIASNYLPFGTKVRFPDYDPDTIYTVQDRMNKRYFFKADIWMKTRTEAKLFGYQRLKMEIYQ